MSNSILGITLMYILVQTVLGMVFAFQSRKYRRNARWILIGLICGIIASVLSLLVQLNQPFFERRILLAFELVLYSLEYMFLNIHFQLASNQQLTLKVNLPLVIFWAIFIFMDLKYLFAGLDNIDELIWDLSYNFIGLYSFTFIAYSLYRSAEFSGEIEALFQSFGALALSIGFIFGALTTPILRNYSNIEPMLSAVTKAIGALIFISIYAVNINFVERMAINTYALLLFDDTGRSLGFYKIRTRRKNLNKESPIVPDLIAPFVTAIQAFVKDIFGKEQTLKTIEARGKSILFQMGNKVHAAIITEKITWNLKNSLKKFQEDCETIAGQIIVNNMKPLGNDIVKEKISLNFPYIQVLDIRNMEN